MYRASMSSNTLISEAMISINSKLFDNEDDLIQKTIDVLKSPDWIKSISKNDSENEAETDSSTSSEDELNSDSD